MYKRQSYNPALGEATAGADGRYALEGLAAGEYWLTASLSGARASGFRTVAVAAGGTSALDVELEGLLSATVRGRVVDAGGAPVAGARVAQAGGGASAETDAQGEFALEGLAYDERTPARVEASAPGHARAEAIVRAETVAQRFELALPRARSVAGRVVGADGRPVPGARIVASAPATSPQTPSDTRTAVSGADGAFVVDGLRAELRHTLLVRADGHATRAFDLEEDLASTRHDAGTVALGPPGLIAGRAVDDRGEPWRRVYVELARAPAPGGRADRLLARRTSNTDDDGRFVFADLGAGAYVLGVRPFDGPTKIEVPVEVAEGESRADLAVEVARGLAIEGRVLAPDARPCAGVFVTAFAAAEPTKLVGSASTGSDGAFAVRGLGEGSFVLRAQLSMVAAPEVAAVAAQGRWGPYAAGTAGLELALPRAAPITGRVVDAEGRAAAGANVEAVEGERWGEPDATARTGADGSFRLAVREGGTFEVAARPARTPPGRAERRVGAVAAGTGGLELRLEPR